MPHAFSELWLWIPAFQVLNEDCHQLFHLVVQPFSLRPFSSTDQKASSALDSDVGLRSIKGRKTWSILVQCSFLS